MKFSDVPAHDVVKNRLRAMVDSNRIPHALLLEGPEGIGKFSVARALAQYIHCEHPTDDGEPCGECRSCRQHQSFNHIDTTFSFPVVKLDSHGNTPPNSDDFFAQWKNFIEGNLFLDMSRWVGRFDKKNAVPIFYVTESDRLLQWTATTAHASRYKIVLVWLPERMGDEIANKLLKLIEEPHSDTLFIMTSNDPEAILPTIRSRCQRVEMRRLPDDVIAHYLIDRHGLDNADANALAHIADGSMSVAERLLENGGESSIFFNLFIGLMRAAYQRRVAVLRDWAGEVSAMGREKELKFFDYCSRLVRENFVYNFAVPELVYMTTEEQSFSRNFARFINERNAPLLIDAFDTARRDIAGNGNGKIINFDLAIRVILLLKSA